jgi:hypothetical protein
VRRILVQTPMAAGDACGLCADPGWITDSRSLP